MPAQYTYRKRTNALSELVAGRIRSLRRARGLTQYELADLCGTSQGTVNKWETRLVPIDLEDLEKVAEVLGVEPWQLLDPQAVFTVERIVVSRVSNSGKAGQPRRRLRSGY